MNSDPKLASSGHIERFTPTDDGWYDPVIATEMAMNIHQEYECWMGVFGMMMHFAPPPIMRGMFKDSWNRVVLSIRGEEIVNRVNHESLFRFVLDQLVRLNKKTDSKENSKSADVLNDQ